MKSLFITVLAFSLIATSLPSRAEDVSQFTKFAGFQLESKLPLSEVEKRIGKANLIETGEAGEYEAKICYTTPNGVVSFLSSEMGGPDHELLGFSIANRTQESESTCRKPNPDKIPSDLTIGGIRLGMTQQEFTATLGSKVQWKGNTGRYHIQITEPLSPEELERVKKLWSGIVERPYADVLVSIIGTFENGALIEYQIWKISTI